MPNLAVSQIKGRERRVTLQTLHDRQKPILGDVTHVQDQVREGCISLEEGMVNTTVLYAIASNLHCLLVGRKGANHEVLAKQGGFTNEIL